eukprot:CAMPEP_0174757906 /NCGR_PEP_ID=MMETSP1094-20130205/107493_1 /TAXON_ID=156173 /ORGANISM="Chrysochromulina brevifilum, Strain UTEX LB 985" /LENGTH=81 /DNA_ID=CAMNT_0015963825 /DNA_START=65 /DNA_END=311 /DNA_ORIENTATION=-
MTLAILRLVIRTLPLLPSTDPLTRYPHTLHCLTRRLLSHAAASKKSEAGAKEEEDDDEWQEGGLEEGAMPIIRWCYAFDCE